MLPRIILHGRGRDGAALAIGFYTALSCLNCFHLPPSKDALGPKWKSYERPVPDDPKGLSELCLLCIYSSSKNTAHHKQTNVTLTFLSCRSLALSLPLCITAASNHLSGASKRCFSLGAIGQPTLPFQWVEAKAGRGEVLIRQMGQCFPSANIYMQ